MRPRFSSARTVLLAMALAFAAGCTHFSVDTPADFAALHTSHTAYRYRSVAAYGVAIGVRQLPNSAHGNLGFWTEAIDRHLQQSGEYHPAGQTEVHTQHGLVGHRLEYRRGDAQSGPLYWVTVFVTPKRVFVLEAGGREEAFTRARASVEHAIATFDAS